MSVPKIAIIGAGLAGLTAAYRLQQKGLPAEVYEARPRAGGRVLTIRVKGSSIELGAQNILDGGESTHILKLIDDLGLKTVSTDKVFHLSYFDGKSLSDPFAQLKTKYNFTADNLMPALQKAAETASNMQEVLQNLFKDDKQLIKSASNLLAGYEGSPANKLSTYYVKTLYYMLLGGLSEAHQSNEESTITMMEIDEGNSRLPEELAGRIGGRLHLSTELKTLKKFSSGYQLAFSNGEDVFADIVVLTIPCPVYKNIEFGPHVLSQHRLETIRALQYGSTSKIVSPLKGKAVDRGSYSNDRSVAFYNRNCMAAHVYYTGGNGYFTRSNIESVFSKELPMLEHVYSLDENAKKVEYASEKPFANYDDSVGYCWTLEPFSLGSYSCVGAGQEAAYCTLENIGNEQVKTLFAPEDNTLYFAGEHTSILLNVGGTMEAAVESGDRTARMIHAFHGDKS